MGNSARGDDASEGTPETESREIGPDGVEADGDDETDDKGYFIADNVTVGPTENVLDLAYLRDLLSILNTHKVAGFSGSGIQVTFQEETPWVETTKANGATREDEDRSTSSKRVSGFSSERRDGFHHPSLWQSQNGKILRFNGDLE